MYALKSVRCNLCLVAVMAMFLPQALFAGECLTSDSDLLAAQKGFYQSAKQNGLGEYEDGWGLSCWRHDEGLDNQLKKVMVEMMNDSSIHPAYVAEVVNDYFFNDLHSQMKLMQKSQGPARYALIKPLIKKPYPPEVSPLGPQGHGGFDYIDGPANIRNKPKGDKVTSLPDNTRVRVLQEKGNWVQIEAGEVSGWTFHRNLMGRLLGKQGPDAFPVLSRAAFMGYANTVDFLLAMGADVNVVDRFGRNALHWATLGTSFDLDEVAHDILKKLCAVKGAEANQRDKEGKTPLFTAVTLMDLGVIETLLGVPGVDATIADNHGNTPLVYAIGWKRRDIFEKLLASSPQLDINVADNDGETLLAFAVSSNPKVVPELLEFEAIDLERADKKGRTPLYRAVELRETELVKLLLKHGARIDTVDKEGNSLLHAYLDNRDPYKRNKGQEIFELLVNDSRVAADRTNVHGIPPLYRVITQGWVDGVRMLLTRSDVDVNRRFKRDSYHCDESYLGLTLDSIGLKNTRKMALLLLDREDIDVNVEITNDRMTPIFFPHDMWRGEKYSLAIAEKILAHKPNLELENKYGETPLTNNIKKGNIKVVELLLKAGADINHSRNGSKDGVYYGPSMTPLKYAEKWGKADIVALLKNFNAQDYHLLGGAEVSPEGIPQELLQNDKANEAIRFYRGYLVKTGKATIKQLEEGQIKEAIEGQEFILDEILVEVGTSFPKFSVQQRKRAKQTFEAIHAYYRDHQRVESDWFKEIETKMDAVLTGRFDDLPDGELHDHSPMVPILILRGYMARNAIEVLKLVRDGKAGKAAELLAAAVAKSEPGALILN